MAIINSNGTGGGLWSLTASWNGGVIPVEGDNIVIVSGDTIEVDGIYVVGNDTSTYAIDILSGGTLKASRTITSSIKLKGTLYIKNGGILDYGLISDRIPTNITATLLLNYSATPVDVKYVLECVEGGQCHMNGAERTITSTITTDILTGANSVDVSDVTGWKVGDIVMLAATQDYTGTNYTDLTTVSGISGNTITFTDVMNQDHLTGGYIGLFSSNVIVKNDPASTVYSCVKLWAGNLTITAGITLSYVEITRGGSINSNFYGVLSLKGDNNDKPEMWIINHLMITKTRNYCIDSYNNEAVFSDCNFNAVDLTTGNKTAFQLRQTARNVITNCYFFKGNYSIGASWSQGPVGVVISNCKFMMCFLYAVNGTGQGIKINNCDFICCNTCTRITWGTSWTFTGCNFGVISPYSAKCKYVWGTGVDFSNTITYYKNCYTNYVTALKGSISSSVSADYRAIFSDIADDPLQQIIDSALGTIYRDNSTFNSGVASLRFEPVSSTNALSFELDILAPTNKPVVVSGYMRKNTSYGSATLPSVKLSGLGIVEDTFTMTDVNDEWVQFKLQATQTTGTDGVLTFTAYSQSGTVGAMSWIDSVSVGVPSAINTGDLGYWAGGQPAKVIMASFVSANDVWNVQANQLTLDGSIGVKNKEINKSIYNRVKINSTNKTLEIYDDDNITLLKEFDTVDSNGNPSSTEIYERIPK